MQIAETANTLNKTYKLKELGEIDKFWKNPEPAK